MRCTDRSSSLILPGVCLAMLLAGASCAAPAAGPLRVHPANPRYFTDTSGKAVYLTGSHVWFNLQDYGPDCPPARFDYESYLAFMKSRGHNFMRLWIWEQARWMSWLETGGDGWLWPLPYERTGPGTALDGRDRFDLHKFDQAFFDRLRARVVQAGDQGIYVSIMLFQGWSVDRNKGKGPDPWQGHPFHRLNNINGIDGDTNGDGSGRETHSLSNPAINELQAAFVRKVIDTVNDLDNVLFEITNEDLHSKADTAWQYHIIDLIHNYEKDKPHRHPVGMTHCNYAGRDAYLHESPADWISPAYDGNYRNDPRANPGDKVIILDTDHLWGLGGDGTWVWKCFLRGLNPVFMDDWVDVYTRPGSESWEVDARLAMGGTAAWAVKLDLLNMTPQDRGSSPASTGYCLYRKGREYLVFQPDSGGFTVELEPGTYAYAWARPPAGNTDSAGSLD